MSTKIMHREVAFIPLNDKGTAGEPIMESYKKLNGCRVEFKTIKAAEKFCLKNNAPVIVERRIIAHRVINNNKK